MIKISENKREIQNFNDMHLQGDMKRTQKIKMNNVLEKDTFTLQNFKKNSLVVKLAACAAALSLIGGIISQKVLPNNEERKEIKITEKNKLINTPKVIINDFIQDITNNVQHSQAAAYYGEIPDGTFDGAFRGTETYCEELCNEYGVEPKLAAAIIGAETCWGTVGVAENNNPFSYRAAGDLGTDEYGFGIFSTPEAGLEAGIRNLGSYRTAYGIDSIDFNHIDEIGQIYCGEDYSHWVNLVSDCYYSIK